jgi:hypothetical protein
MVVDASGGDPAAGMPVVLGRVARRRTSLPCPVDRRSVPAKLLLATTGCEAAGALTTAPPPPIAHLVQELVQWVLSPQVMLPVYPL